MFGIEKAARNWNWPLTGIVNSSQGKGPGNEFVGLPEKDGRPRELVNCPANIGKYYQIVVCCCCFIALCIADIMAIIACTHYSTLQY